MGSKVLQCIDGLFPGPEIEFKYFSCLSYSRDRSFSSRQREVRKLLLTLLIPESDQHLISPFNITHESNIKVVRIKEMIIN